MSIAVLEKKCIHAQTMMKQGFWYLKCVKHLKSSFEETLKIKMQFCRCSSIARVQPTENKENDLKI